MLEFQARQTRTAARMGICFPSERERWSEIALHGLRYLTGPMADDAEGGWYWLIDHAGGALHAETKHAHGISYLITTAIDVFRLTADATALALAVDAHAWLERVHRDRRHGGYHGWSRRDGTLILSAQSAPAGSNQRWEPLGHEIGLKDANVNSDILEAYTALYALLPSEALAATLRELATIITTRFVTPDGGMHYLLRADLSPVDAPMRYGYVLQLPARLQAVAAVLGDQSIGAAAELARRAMDHALARGWDEERGLFWALEPAAGDRAAHDWWVQTEALRSLSLMAVTQPSGGYRQPLERLVMTTAAELIDERHGGWHYRPPRDEPWRSRMRGGPPKGDPWKDASHEADAYSLAVRALLGLAEGAALE